MPVKTKQCKLPENTSYHCFLFSYYICLSSYFSSFFLFGTFLINRQTANGNTYSGYWSKGVKHGKGKFTFDLAGKAIVQKGYWKNGDYFGNTNPDELYRITNQSGIESCTITKKESEEVQIRISFVGAMAKYVPRDLEVTTTSGQLTKENKNFTIYNYSSPNLCTVRFVIPTAGGDRICSLSFEILTVGEYEVLITN